MGMRYPRKRDDNERDIVNALRARGATVSHLDDSGVPDLLVGYRGNTFLLEVKLPSNKDGTAHKRKAQGGEGELTESQVKWWQTWLGSAPSIVHNVHEALTAIGVPPAPEFFLIY